MTCQKCKREDLTAILGECIGCSYARVIQELEIERMRLAGCGVAAMANTERSKKQRIGRDNPYWSASYGDVCAAVDREMKYREALKELRDALGDCSCDDPENGHDSTNCHLYFIALNALEQSIAQKAKE